MTFVTLNQNLKISAHLCGCRLSSCQKERMGRGGILKTEATRGCQNSSCAHPRTWNHPVPECVTGIPEFRRQGSGHPPASVPIFFSLQISTLFCLLGFKTFHPSVPVTRAPSCRFWQHPHSAHASSFLSSQTALSFLHDL